ncbi:MAG: glycosyltransferase family 1 protein [Candidatus Peregrinibacteria bacterium]|nr:glycosyltransferase family 1 protein [Candidatus Peregrinibacteria bacterium]
MKKVIIVTDVWGNINGVVTSIVEAKKGLEKKNLKVKIVHPELFSNLPLPTNSEIKLAIMTGSKLKEIFKKTKPDFIHIATEGPLGLAARIFCTKNHLKFTTSYHTKLPEYIAIRMKIGVMEPMIWKYIEWFHETSEKVMVSTESLKKELEKHKIKKGVIVPLGIDLKLFKKNKKTPALPKLHKPIFTFLGRVAPEKNVEAFLKLNLPGTKLIIGDGPSKKALEKKFTKNTVFVGYKKGQDIVDLLSISDVFVFPSKTDTFGLVLLESLACGLPIAAYNVQGPKDIIENGKTGYIGSNLKENALKCLTIDKINCRKEAEKYSWNTFTKEFIKNLVPAQPSEK